MSWQGNIIDETTRRGTWAPKHQVTSSGPIGIIAVSIDYPKIPGNVVNPFTYDFPVMFSTVEFEIERLFAGDPTLEDMIVDAAKELEAAGCVAVIGACGFFAHFQQAVSDAVNIPAFLSSLTQLPLIETGLRKDQKLAIIAADGKSITPELIRSMKGDPDRAIVVNVGDHEAFLPIRYQQVPLENGALIDDMMETARKLKEEHPELGAILLECSDLTPYSADVQRASGLPVYDFITLINWVQQACCQPTYYGFL